jgi:single-strand DNA-binding protein
MANYNKVILAGNLTRDPQLSYTPNNTPVVEFGLAVNRRWRGQDGNQREETCFVDLRAYGRQAETINQYMSKGRAILIEGRLQFQQWTGQDGQKRSRHMVIVENSQFLGGGRGAGGGGRGADSGRPPDEQPPPPSDDDAGGGAGGQDSDIPF